MHNNNMSEFDFRMNIWSWDFMTLCDQSMQLISLDLTNIKYCLGIKSSDRQHYINLFGAFSMSQSIYQTL